MSKYVLSFSKEGLIRYTSHLDLLRIFKRAFRRAGIEVSYSQGFNPHPRMGFCQPLSLGYFGANELIEFQTDSDKGRTEWIREISECLPEGIVISKLGLIGEGQKSLAGSVVSADYIINFHVPYNLKNFGKLTSDYMEQDAILCDKKTKSGKTVSVDIKDKIRKLEPCDLNGDFALSCSLDAGSDSNLSPELLIRSYMDFALGYHERYDVDVCRKSIGLIVDYKITWM